MQHRGQHAGDGEDGRGPGGRDRQALIVGIAPVHHAHQGHGHKEGVEDQEEEDHLMEL